MKVMIRSFCLLTHLCLFVLGNGLSCTLMEGMNLAISTVDLALLPELTVEMMAIVSKWMSVSTEEEFG